jgi:hypothetical protein
MASGFCFWGNTAEGQQVGIQVEVGNILVGKPVCEQNQVSVTASFNSGAPDYTTGSIAWLGTIDVESGIPKIWDMSGVSLSNQSSNAGQECNVAAATCTISGGDEAIKTNSIATNSTNSTNATPKKPCGCVQKVKNFSGSMVDFAKDGFAVVDNTEYLRRVAVCQHCPNLQGSVCGLCGCLVNIKAWGRAWDCPDKPSRWAKWS